MQNLDRSSFETWEGEAPAEPNACAKRLSASFALPQTNFLCALRSVSSGKCAILISLIHYNHSHAGCSGSGVLLASVENNSDASVVT
jgi:hypothetical protein